MIIAWNQVIKLKGMTVKPNRLTGIPSRTIYGKTQNLV